MRVIEIVSAQIADELTKGGTKFEMDPDKVIWPDGTITKKSNPPKKGKKTPAPGSKHGVFGVIVATYGGKSNAKDVTPQPQPTAISIEPSQTPSETTISSGASSSTPEKQKQTRRCNYIFIFAVQNKEFQSVFTLSSMYF